MLGNHFHLVLRIDGERARAWSDGDIVERYGRLFRNTAERWQQLPPSRAADRIACWRARLSHPSWFMRCLNESIARRANREDGCTGRFWEGRFRSQALLDEAGLFACMSYVDLTTLVTEIRRHLGRSFVLKGNTNSFTSFTSPASFPSWETTTPRGAAPPPA